MARTKQQTPAQRRRQQQRRVQEIVKNYAGNDPFGGLGDWDPADAPKIGIARAIAALEGLKIPKPKAAKPKPVKRAPKPKPAPKPKKGKKVGNVNEVMVKSPRGHTQTLEVKPELRELLLTGWQIVEDAATVERTYELIHFKPEEMHHA